MQTTLLATLFAASVLAQQPTMPGKPTAVADDDAFLFLEDVTGEKALTWVRAQNAESQRVLADTEPFRATKARILAVLDSKARIPYVQKHGAFFYNLWQDAANPRGVWRRTTLDEYQKDAPAWQTVLDLDALGRAEGENWVWKGATFLEPEHERVLLSLSRGGADAAVTREFDVTTQQFVANGFFLPEAKGGAAWRDRDTLLVSTDFGPGTMTTSGYPRQARWWRRGTPLASATLIAEAAPEHVSIGIHHDHTEGFERTVVRRALTFYTDEAWLWREGLIKIDKPDSAEASLHREWLFLHLRDDWTVGDSHYPAGSLLATRLEAFLAGERRFDVLFAPAARSSLAGFAPTRHHVLLNVLDHVRNRVEVLTPGDGGWQRAPLPGLPGFSTIGVGAVDADHGDDYFLTITDYLTPTSLWFGTIGQGPARQLKSLPAFFATNDLMVEQREAVSKDGTRVPYFLVRRRDLVRNGENPTLLYGYGGFEISMTPAYSASVGTAWLEQGGVFVVANIRGGGEFGPKWHQAALMANRHRAYEDFAAVAMDLITQQITSPRHLGAQGGSNGGLLMGNMLTTYPELFHAIVCQVPLLDMLRYHQLLAGASWIGEYGDPDDPKAREWLRRYSPFHNLHAGTSYPKVLFTTSTRDDRVHPGHARKMMARLQELGKAALYYENIEGGHGGAADNQQAAHMAALAYTFLWQQLR